MSGVSKPGDIPVSQAQARFMGAEIGRGEDWPREDLRGVEVGKLSERASVAPPAVKACKAGPSCKVRQIRPGRGR